MEQIDQSPTAEPRTWTIARGDHLWHVAEHTLTEAWGVTPSVADIARYHHDLIETNRSVLVVRNNPDLVYAGQVFALPPVPEQ